MGVPGGWFIDEHGTTSRCHRAGPIRQVLRRLLGRSGGFRMVQLNLAGWAALLAPGVAVGVLMGYLLGGHVLVVALAGALLAWLVGLVVDSLCWRASTILFSCPAVPVESLERLVQDLRAEGVEAVLEPGQV